MCSYEVQKNAAVNAEFSFIHFLFNFHPLISFSIFIHSFPFQLLSIDILFNFHSFISFSISSTWRKVRVTLAELPHQGSSWIPVRLLHRFYKLLERYYCLTSSLRCSYDVAVPTDRRQPFQPRKQCSVMQGRLLRKRQTLNRTQRVRSFPLAPRAETFERITYNRLDN